MRNDVFLSKSIPIGTPEDSVRAWIELKKPVFKGDASGLNAFAVEKAATLVRHYEVELWQKVVRVLDRSHDEEE